MERELTFRLEYDPELRAGMQFFSAKDKQLQAALAKDEKFQRRFDSLHRRFCEVVTELHKEAKNHDRRPMAQTPA